MARSLRQRLKITIAAAIISVGMPIGGAGALTVFDPSVYAGIIQAYNTAKETLSTITDTYNTISNLYSEVSGYIQFAQSITTDPARFFTNTVQCLFNINFGPLRTRSVSLCDVAQSVVSELTLSANGTTPQPPTNVTAEQQATVDNKRQSLQQESALRGIALGKHTRDTADDSANTLRDLQIAASTAETLIPINKVAMQAAVLQAKELQAIRLLLANLVEMQGATTLRQTPLLFTGAGSIQPSTP